VLVWAALLTETFTSMHIGLCTPHYTTMCIVEHRTKLTYVTTTNSIWLDTRQRIGQPQSKFMARPMRGC